MRNNMIKRNKLNNAGMTLIEILIAIAIFTVAIIPMLYGFVYMTRFNGKGRQLQQTSVVAQSVMEKCKAYDVNEISMKMNDGSFIPGALEYVTGSAPSGSYTYYLNDLTMDNQVYDVRLDLVPYGDKEDLMDYTDMNPYLDAVFMAQTTTTSSGSSITAAQLDQEAYIDILEEIQLQVEQDSISKEFNASGVKQYNELTMNLSEIEDSFKSGGLNDGNLYINRKIEVRTVTEPSGVEKALVTYTYSYTLADAFQYEIEDISDPSNPNTNTESVTITGTDISDTFTIYDNTQTRSHGTRLQNVYLFYYPGYVGNTYGNTDGVDIPYNKEIISLKNELGRDVNIYLIKQQDLGLSQTNLASEEVAYKPQLEAVSSGSTKIHLYYNLLVDISGSGSTVSFQEGDANCIDLTSKTYLTLQVAPTYAIGTPEEDKNKNYSFIMREEKQLMYTVNVAVYQNNAYETSSSSIPAGTPSIVTLDGTMLNW